MEDVLKYFTENNWIDFIFNNNIPGFFITILLTLLVARLAKRALNKFLNKVDDSTQDKTNYYFLRYVVIALVYGIGFTLAMYNVPAFRAFGTTLLAGAGVFALAISFASQQALSNIISGLFIVIFKPFKIRDRILMKSQGHEGVIEDITLRHTVIRDYENRRIIVPNSIISNETIINSDYREGKICKQLIFSIGYDSNIETAKKIITEEAIKHPLTFDNRTKKERDKNLPIVLIRVVSLGESSVDLKAFIWVKDHATSLELSSDLFQAIKIRFDSEGILIPYPHRTIELINKS